MSRDGIVRVGIIGRGFGEKVAAPAFQATEGCEVVDVVSPRDPAAVAALCARDDVELISIHSPPFLHLDHVRLSLEGGHPVLCEKPFGRDSDEAAKMCSLADSAAALGFLNFEFRCDPERERLRELVRGGAVGEPEHFLYVMHGPLSRLPLRPHGWLFDRELGGGWLGALGSHMIDFVRWTFGEIADGAAQLRTVVAERPDAEGKMQRCTADDSFTALLRTESGVSATIESSSTAPIMMTPVMTILGSEGVLELTADHRITLRRSDGSDEEIRFEPRESSMKTVMGRWASTVCRAVREGSVPEGAPTFADGLACARVMDRIGRRTAG